MDTAIITIASGVVLGLFIWNIVIPEFIRLIVLIFKLCVFLLECIATVVEYIILLICRVLVYLFSPAIKAIKPFLPSLPPRKEKLSMGYFAHHRELWETMQKLKQKDGDLK